MLKVLGNNLYGAGIRAAGWVFPMPLYLLALSRRPQWPGQPVEFTSIYCQFAAEDASYAASQIYGFAGGSGNSPRRRTSNAGLGGLRVSP
jgi:hypothetical protein